MLTIHYDKILQHFICMMIKYYTFGLFLGSNQLFFWGGRIFYDFKKVKQIYFLLNKMHNSVADTNILSDFIPILVLAGQVVISGAKNTANSLLEVPWINKVCNITEIILSRTFQGNLRRVESLERLTADNERYFVENYLKPIEYKLEKMVDKLLPVTVSETKENVTLENVRTTNVSVSSKSSDEQEVSHSPAPTD